MTKAIPDEKLRTALLAASLAAVWGFLVEIVLERAAASIFGDEVYEYLPAILGSVVFGALVFLLISRHVARRLEREAMHAREQARLQAAYEELEVRVQERTAELAQSNASLLAEVIERKRAEEELRALLEENARLHKEEQRAMALEERQRLARNLHDSLSQTLYGISLGTQGAREAIQTGMGDPVSALDYVVSLTKTALKDMRALIRELRPESLERDGLVAAITAHVEALCERHPVEARAELGAEPDVSPAIKEALYRIAVEALSNTVRHSHATQADVRLSRRSGEISLEVCDNGLGFEHGPVPGHLGLLSMRERAAQLGGCLDIESLPGRGTCVRATIPVLAPAGG